jgi:S-DNA-T family DNA segregation ATPase FtsK/SpoIIIE
MTERGDTATAAFARPPRTQPPRFATAEIGVAAPPQPLRPERGPMMARLLPVVMAVAMISMMVVVYRSGSAATRSPVFMVFPLMMLVSVLGTVVMGRDRRRGADIDADRTDYLDYLSGLRDAVTNTAAAQRSSLSWCHPQPDALWTLIGGPRMWERRTNDADFGQVRVGIGTAQLATRLMAGRTGPSDRADPVTESALRRFVATHATVPDVPTTIGLFDVAAVMLDGNSSAGRGLLRAMICQLAALHGPDLLLIAAVATDRNRKHWDWLKWLPHHQHPVLLDSAGPARMAYASLAAAEAVLSGLTEQLADRMPPHVVVVVDGGIDGTEQIIAAGPTAGLTVVEVGTGCARLAAGNGLQLRVSATELVARRPDGTELSARPDRMDLTDALVCARRLAGYRVGEPEALSEPGKRAHWPGLLGIADVTDVDPNTLWGNVKQQERLRVPVGTDTSGDAVYLDIKEAAENGIGPHGLCIGATGSGKSELLRTVALGMIARHSPAALNLVLVDFKGGATFLGLERARHVAAVITNLADEASLVARMRDALAGELNRRQELLRSAGNFVSAAAYESARSAGASLAALPALFVIVDEFSELLAQHPDFADMFVAIGRLGRSLGIHLLLASQRLDEGRLRGLESHLSYRVCLKTLSANESRIALGVPDAHELPNTPGLGYLRTAAGELIRFQAAFVSGPCPDIAAPPHGDSTPPAVQLFTAAPSGPITRAEPRLGATTTGRSVLATVLDRLSGHGPPAREVWLPPLGAAPALDSLLSDDVPDPDGADLVVPIGIVDRPFEQRRTPLLVDLRGAAGNVAVIGAPQSGKSTTLTTLVTALAATHDPAKVQLYCLDFGGGALASLAGLPQVGSVAGRAQADLVRRTVAEMESVVARREALFRNAGIGSFAQYRRLRATHDPACGAEKFGDVFLVIDGWAALCREFDTLEAPIMALAGRGLSFGVHVVLSASRWAEVRTGLRDQIGTRIELRLGDPADSELDRRQAQQVPRGKPGRGLTDGGLHALIALPRLDGVDSPSGLARAAVHAGELLRRRHGDAAAPEVPLLPASVGRENLIESVDPMASAGGHPLLGVDEREPVTLDFGRQPHLLILGDNECGKTSVLRTLCREIMRTSTAEQAQLVVVDYRRSLLGVVDTNHFGGYAMSAAALSALLPELLELLSQRMPGPEVTVQQLRDRSWWAGPEVYLLVDDYDLVATAAGNPLTPLLEYLPHAGDVGLHLVVARRSGGAARAVYEPLLAALRDLGCMGLMMSANPDEGPLIGSARPMPLPPGRGTLVTRAGGEQLIQVAWSPPP